MGGLSVAEPTLGAREEGIASGAIGHVKTVFSEPAAPELMRAGEGRSRVLAFVVLLIALAIGPGCANHVGEATITAEPTPGLDVPDKVLAARRAVLNFLRDGANECVPPAGVHWTAALGQAPEGFGVYRFTAGGCVVTVSYPLEVTGARLYHVTLSDGATGFCWQANVDDRGRVVDTGVFAERLPELANAAAAFCTERGHQYELRTRANGIRCGVCTFSDGSACNAWAFFQGACHPGDVPAREWEESLRDHTIKIDECIL